MSEIVVDVIVDLEPDFHGKKCETADRRWLRIVQHEGYSPAITMGRGDPEVDAMGPRQRSTRVRGRLTYDAVTQIEAVLADLQEW